MKNLETQNRLGLFGLLVFSLTLSQGWVERSDSAEANLSSERAPSGVFDQLRNADREKSSGKFTNLKDEDGNNLAEVKFKYELTNKSNPFGLAGEEVLEASFCSSGICMSKTVLESDIDTITELTELFEEAAQEAGIKAQIAKKEKEEKAGDVAQRKKDAKNCKIEIVDIDDESKDIEISSYSSSLEKLSCEMKKFNKKEHRSERLAFSRFKTKFGKEIKELAMSGDEEAMTILQELGSMANESSISDYLFGLEEVTRHNQEAIEAAVMQDSIGLNSLSTLYQTGYAPIYSYNSRGMIYQSGTRTLNSDSLYTRSAYSEVRQDMIRRLQMAMQDPSSLLYLDDYNQPSQLSVGRGNRIATRFQSFPMNTTNNSLSNRGMNNNWNGQQNPVYRGGTGMPMNQNFANQCNGQSIPSNIRTNCMNQQAYADPNYTGRNQQQTQPYGAFRRRI